MESIKRLYPNISLNQILLAIYLFIYVALGINTELQYIDKHPMPASILADYEVYKKSIKTALSGENPYDNDFRYSPPALLVIELFYHIPGKYLQDSFYTAANLALLLGIVYGVAHYYRINITEVWYWFPLALFFGPVLEQFHVGQINIITEFGILLALTTNSTLPVLAGLGLSLAIITKVTPASFLLYFLSTKNWRAIIVTILTVLVLILLAGLRYGFNMYPMYVGNMQSMLDTFHSSSNTQSLFSKLVTNGLVSDAVEVNPTGAQRILNFYFAIIFLASTALSYFNKQKEPLFIILGLGSMLAPNWMWYHHYVFFLVPLFAWIAWSGQDKKILLWCLLGMLIIQIDRWYWTTGLLIHLFGHISIIALLIKQIQSITPESVRNIESPA